MRFLPCILMLAILTVGRVEGTEVDNFTDRDLPLNDSRILLNDKMNGLFQGSLEAVNSSSNCSIQVKSSRERFYKVLNSKIGGFFWAKYENEVNADPSIDKRYFKKRESVYKNLNFINGFAFSLAKLGSVVRVDENYIGTDKLGHFIGIGKIYFDKKRKMGKSVKEVMEYGQYTEKSFFGLTTTGVFSYGDLVANYEGHLFWQNIFDGETPYLKCIEGVFVQVRDFDWLEYVNDAWDESINCNGYRTKAIKQKIAQACPVVPMKSETIMRYSSTPLKILNM